MGHVGAIMDRGGKPNLSFAQIAERAAGLCEVDKTHVPLSETLIYIIGTKAPIPSGESEVPGALDVASVERFHDTIQSRCDAWRARKLDAAWDRILSVVTQPGADFVRASIHPFVPDNVARLNAAILDEVALTYESHSTETNPPKVLRIW